MLEALAFIAIASLFTVLILLVTIYVNEVSWRKHEIKLIKRNAELEAAILQCGLHCKAYLRRHGSDI